jgi:hypothetical protein
MVQFGLVFFPSQIDVVPASKAISQALKIDKGMKPLGEGAVPFSLYPWTLPTVRVTPAPKGARKQKIKMSPRCETSSIPFIRELEPRLGVTSRRDFFLILPRHALATFMLQFKFTLPRSEGRYFGSLSIREMLFAGKLLNSSRHAPGSQYL